MSSTGRPETRTAILDAARTLFEEQGYFGAGLEAVAKKAGVSRQAIYLHFASKADLLTALHLRVFETDVVPALDRYPIWTAASALDALDAAIAVDAEVASKVWRIHEALVVARRHHDEVDATLRPREDERYQDYVRLARWLKRDGALPPHLKVAHVRRHPLGAALARDVPEPGDRARVVDRAVHRLGAGDRQVPAGHRS